MQLTSIYGEVDVNTTLQAFNWGVDQDIHKTYDYDPHVVIIDMTQMKPPASHVAAPEL